MSRSVAEELLALEASGISWSRNKNYELFERAGPKQARRLKRLLAHLQEMIARCRDDPHARVSLHRSGARRGNEVRIELQVIDATVNVHLTEQELEILCRDPAVATLIGRSQTPSCEE